MMKKLFFVKLTIFLLVFSFAISCSASQGQANEGTAFIAKTDDCYQKLGISKSQIESWEDGMRTTGGKGSYEWWYFDSTLKDGSTLVIAFYTKDSIHPDMPLEPKITLDLNRPDGTSIHKDLKFNANAFSASKDGCDVRIGTNTFSGDLHDYTIHVEIDDIKADLKLHGTVPSWRPATGYSFFKNKDEHYFAWLPAVPQGNVEGTLTINGNKQSITGVGYHDHNWGDVSMMDLIHDWYWGRAQIGNYSVISSYVVSADKYDSKPIPIFMLARDGKIIADDSTKVKFTANDVYTDPYTGKPVANVIVYDYNDGSNHYRITFKREKDLLRDRFVDHLHGMQHILAKWFNFDGSYLRFTGQATVERFDGDKVIETVNENGAVWELMYFGHAPKK